MTQSGVFGWLLVYLWVRVDQKRKLDRGYGQVIEGEKGRWKMVEDDNYLDYSSTYDEELETCLYLDACEPVPESLSCIMVGRRDILKLCRWL